MLTKGHHFPDVTLVGILNADQSLFSTDFRATERLAQTIVQVAGRAGRAGTSWRGADPEPVSGSSAAAHAAENGYEGFATSAMAERAAAHWPPFPAWRCCAR